MNNTLLGLRHKARLLYTDKYNQINWLRAIYRLRTQTAKGWLLDTNIIKRG